MEPEVSNSDAEAESTRSVRVYINPLRSHELEAAIASGEVDGDAILRFICDLDVDTSPEGFVARYREISSGCESRLFIAPLEEKVFGKLVLPLRHAKASFLAGNYLATISLSGMVAEMCALFEFELAEVRVGTNQLDTKAQEHLFGMSFEKLGQDRRVKALFALGLIDDGTVREFDQIRGLRKKYLHLWSEDGNAVAKDAAVCFQSAAKLVDKVLGFDIKDGNIIFHPRLAKYLESKRTLDSASEV